MKILLATDGSTFSETAEKTLIALIRPQGIEVLALEVVEPPGFPAVPQMDPSYAPEQAERMKEIVAQAKKDTEAAAARLRAAGFKADSRVVESDVRNGILNTAEKWKPDLIVLGSQGRRGLAKFLLGSVAEAVARHAKCSVFIARAPAEGVVARAA
jgi:nucleotide-binding universal stress UspA family protein